VTVSTHDIGLEVLDGMPGVDSLCLFITEDERPLKGIAGFVDWRLCGGLSRVLLGDFFTGSPEDKLLFPTSGRLAMHRIFVIGLGKQKALTADGLGRAMATAAATLSRAAVQSVALEIPGAGALEESARAEALSRSFLPGFKGARVAVLAEKALRQLIPASGK
jgi:hypothetical protein